MKLSYNKLDVTKSSSVKYSNLKESISKLLKDLENN